MLGGFRDSPNLTCVVFMPSWKDEWSWINYSFSCKHLWACLSPGTWTGQQAISGMSTTYWMPACIPGSMFGSTDTAVFNSTVGHGPVIYLSAPAPIYPFLDTLTFHNATSFLRDFPSTGMAGPDSSICLVQRRLSMSLQAMTRNVPLLLYGNTDVTISALQALQ